MSRARFARAVAFALLASVAALSLFVGCRGSDETEAAQKPAASASASSSLPVPTNPRAEAIPTEQDFEEKATREIQAANLAAELDRLEKEIRK